MRTPTEGRPRQVAPGSVRLVPSPRAQHAADAVHRQVSSRSRAPDAPAQPTFAGRAMPTPQSNGPERRRRRSRHRRSHATRTSYTAALIAHLPWLPRRYVTCRPSPHPSPSPLPLITSTPAHTDTRPTTHLPPPRLRPPPQPLAPLPDLSGRSRKGRPAHSGGRPFLESPGVIGILGGRRGGGVVRTKANHQPRTTNHEPARRATRSPCPPTQGSSCRPLTLSWWINPTASTH